MNRIILAAALAGAGFTALSVGTTIAQTAPAPLADGDQITTRADALAAADRRFDRMDANKDGKLTPDEMRPPRPMADASAPPADGGPPPPPPPQPANSGNPGRGPGMFARLDTNGDGVVDREEFRAVALRRFDRIDTNKDGKIDADERQAARDFRVQMRGPRGGPGGDAPPPPPPGAPDDKPGQ